MALIDDFEDATNQIDREFASLERRALSEALSLTRGYVREVRGVLAETDLQTIIGNRQSRNAILRLTNDYRLQMTDLIRRLFGDMFNLGLDSVRKPLAAIGETFAASVDDGLLSGAIGSAELIGQSVASGLQRGINANIRLGALGDLSVSKLMGRIRKSVATQLVSIRRTLRTETTRIFNLAHNALANVANKAIKPTLLKQWLTVGDSRVRPSHRAAGRARPIPVSQLFAVGADRLRYPGDPRGSAGETINCRCRMRVLHPKVIDEKQTA